MSKHELSKALVYAGYPVLIGWSPYNVATARQQRHDKRIGPPWSHAGSVSEDRYFSFLSCCCNQLQPILSPQIAQWQQQHLSCQVFNADFYDAFSRKVRKRHSDTLDWFAPKRRVQRNRLHGRVEELQRLAAARDAYPVRHRVDAFCSRADVTGYGRKTSLSETCAKGPCRSVPLSPSHLA